MDTKPVSTPAAPPAAGPYAQAVVAGTMVFVSGQIPLDPATGTLVSGGIGAQTHRVLESIRSILTAAGSSLDQAVRITVYLVRMEDFTQMNAVYSQFFTRYPARVTVAVSGLPAGAAVEMDCIAVVADPPHSAAPSSIR